MHATKLRTPTIDDASAVAALSAELGYEVSTELVAARIASLQKRSDHYVMVAELDRALVGWIQVHTCESIESGFRAEIVGLVVGSSFRRIGIGKMLVEDAIRWSREHGADVLVVRSNVIREEGHQFYPSVGFEQTKTQAVYSMCLR